MKLVASVVVNLVLSASSLLAVEAPVRLVSEFGGKPAVAPTQDGYGVVWWDFRDAGSPGRPEGGLRAMPLDASGHPSGPDVPLEITDEYGLSTIYDVLTWTHLETVPGGFVLFAQEDGYEMDTLQLDRAGRPSGPSHQLLLRDELYPASIAARPGAIVMTYPEWNWGFQNWSQVVDAQGFAQGARRPLAMPQRGGTGSGFYTLDSQVTRSAEGFVAVWNQYPIGIRLRDMTSNGQPTGDPATIHPYACTRNVAVAAAGQTQAIVYSEGCAQTDVHLLLRDRDGIRGPLVLADEPYSEGIDFGNDAFHPLRVASTGSAFAIVYPVATATPRSGAHWIFSEFDASGSKVGATRDLTVEFAFEAFDDLEFVFDEKRGRYVVVWGGGGPEGYGLYMLALEPAR